MGSLILPLFTTSPSSVDHSIIRSPQLPGPLNSGASATFASLLRIVCDKICIFPETQSILTEYNKWKVILEEMKI